MSRANPNAMYDRSSQASRTVRRFAERYVKELKKRWDEFVDYVGYLGFGRPSFDHVRVDDFRNYFTHVIPLSALKGGWMYGAFAHPSGRVYATTDMGTFFVSDDYGKTFASVPSSAIFGHVFHVAINPNNPDHIVIASTDGIFVSFDGGVTCKRGRLAVGKYLEEGAESTFKGVPTDRRQGDGWNFQGWGDFRDVANWTSERWKGVIDFGSGTVSRLDAFGAIFSQDIFFSGYESGTGTPSYVQSASTHNRMTSYNALSAVRRDGRGKKRKDVILFDSNGRIVYRGSDGNFVNSNSRDFSDPNASDGCVAYRRRGRVVTDTGARSLVADTVLTNTDWSCNQDLDLIRYYMFYRVAFAPSNPDIVYALSGYSPRQFDEFATGNYKGFANDISQNTTPDVSTTSDRSFSDSMNWWSMSYVWMSCDGGESWLLLGHTVGMWQAPNPVPNWWKDLFQNYDGSPGGFPNFRGTSYGQRRLTSSGDRSILRLPFWHLTNNALSDGQDLSFEATASGSTLNGQYFAPGIMMFDLAVNPQDPFDVAISGSDMFASFARCSRLSFTANGRLIQFPWRTLRPYFSGGLFRIRLNEIKLLDPSNNDNLTIQVFNPGDINGLSHTIITNELCDLNSDYLWYSAKCGYNQDIPTDGLAEQTNGLQDVIDETPIDWVYRVYFANARVGQTYLMRSVKRGYSQTGAFVSFVWQRETPLESSWSSRASSAFWHNGCVALRWLDDGLYATLIPRWRRLRDGGNQVFYTLSTISGKSFALFECSPLVAKIEFDQDSPNLVTNITPILSYHQEQYRIAAGQWSTYKSEFGVGGDNQFSGSNIDRAPHRWMKFLYSVWGTSESTHQLSVRTSESDIVPVLELPCYFANSWFLDRFLDFESQLASYSRFTRYGEIMNSFVNNYNGYSLSEDVNESFRFYGLFPLLSGVTVLDGSSRLMYFPLGLHVDENFIFVACGTRRPCGFLNDIVNSIYPNTVVSRIRQPSVFAIMLRSDTKPCFVGSGGFSAPRNISSSSLRYANGVVYLVDLLDPPFPSWFRWIVDNNVLDSTTQLTCAYNLSAISLSNSKALVFTSISSRGAVVELDFSNRSVSARSLQISEFVSWQYPALFPLRDIVGSLSPMREATIRSLAGIGDDYLNALNRVLDNNPSLVERYSSRMPVWAKGSGFEETANINTSWCAEPNLIAYWDEHQMNAIKLSGKSGLNNMIVQWLLNEISTAKTFSAYDYGSNTQTVEGSNLSIRGQTFRSGLSVLGDDDQFVYYAFQYYLPTMLAASGARPSGLFVGVVRISKQLLSDPESLGVWFDAVHALGLVKRQTSGSGWVWSREINKHVQFLTPVARIRNVSAGDAIDNGVLVLSDLNDFSVDNFDMGLASFAPAMLWGRNDSSDGGISGRVVDRGDHTVIYIWTSQSNAYQPANHTHAQSMRKPDSNEVYTLGKSNRKYFPQQNYGSNGFGPPTPTSTEDGTNQLNYGQMFNSKIYRLVVSKNRVYTGFMYLKSSSINGTAAKEVVFDFVNPFDRSLECLNDDTYYALEYHPNVLQKHVEIVDEMTGRPSFIRFYIPNSNSDLLNRWTNERWGYWLKQDDVDPRYVRGWVYRLPYSGGGGIDHRNTNFFIYEFVRYDSKTSVLYSHVSAVPYKPDGSNLKIDFDDVRHGWVEWDVPGFLWDCLGAPSRNTPSFIVDPFKENNPDRLLVLAQMAFPRTLCASVSSTDSLGLYPKNSSQSVAWRGVFFDVRKEDGVWRWYALHPKGLLAFSAHYYISVSSGPLAGRFRNGVTLFGSQYADTVCYNWLERNGQKVTVSDATIQVVADGVTYEVDLNGRFRDASQTNVNYQPTTPNSNPSQLLPFPMVSSVSSALEAGNLEVVDGRRELDLYYFSHFQNSPTGFYEGVALMRSDSSRRSVAPTAFGFYLSPDQSNGVRVQTCRSSYTNDVESRIYSFGNSLFRTRNFNDTSYWGKFARYFYSNSDHLNSRLLSPYTALLRLRMKNVDRYPLLFGNDPVQFPFDPAYGRMEGLDRSIFSDVKFLLEFCRPHFPSHTLKYVRGLLFAAFSDAYPVPEMGSYNGYIFVSADRGETWTAIKMPFLFAGVRSLDVHPETFDLLIGASGAYPMVFRSVGYHEFLRRLKGGAVSRRMPIKRYELSGRKR